MPAELPYGVPRHGDSVAAFAAGWGITLIRAFLNDLPHDTAVTLLYRVSDVATTLLRAEIEALVADRGWTLHYLSGAGDRSPMTSAHLRALAPDLARSDVYVCGPESFRTVVRTAVRDVGVPEQRVHHEASS